LVTGVVGLAATALTVGPASAATFDFSNQGGFTFGTETSTDLTLINVFPQNAIRFFGLQPDNSPPLTGDQYSTIGWGGSTAPSFVTGVDPIGQNATSALKVETLAGEVTDNGIPVPIAILTHQNEPIRPRSLNTVVIDSILRLTDGATSIDLGAGATSSVEIKLVETFNEEPCDPDIQIGATPCTDYFIFPLDVFAPVTFTHEGVDYTITFGLTPLAGTIFETVDCADPAGAPVDPETFEGALCGRIRTVENGTNQILITMALTSEEEPTNACPRTQGYWKNHPGHIDVALGDIDFLVVGGVNYTQEQLIDILKTPPRGNASIILIHQLIATKLNLLVGSDPDPILDVVLEADALLTGIDLTEKVKTSSPLGQDMVEAAGKLDAYNNGLDTPDCTKLPAIK
jgi:hypothetical protein